MSELKSCPFCGRVPIVDDCGDNRFFVRCKCGIAQDKLYGQRCDAVRRWNTRRQQQERVDKDTNVPTNDTISRQAAIYGLDVESLTSSEYAEEVCTALANTTEAIKALLSEQPERKKGKWLNIHLEPDDITGHACGECSRCHKNRIVDNFCPNCGARMEVEE